MIDGGVCRGNHNARGVAHFIVAGGLDCSPDPIHAVNQMPVRRDKRRAGATRLHVFAPDAASPGVAAWVSPCAKSLLASDEVQDRFEALRAFLVALGDEVTVKQLRSYVAFRRLKNFACVQVHPKELVVIAKVDPNSMCMLKGLDYGNHEPGSTRDSSASL
jgi:predicted transport protein